VRRVTFSFAIRIGEPPGDKPPRNDSFAQSKYARVGAALGRDRLASTRWLSWLPFNRRRSGQAAPARSRRDRTWRSC